MIAKPPNPMKKGAKLGKYCAKTKQKIAKAIPELNNEYTRRR